VAWADRASNRRRFAYNQLGESDERKSNCAFCDCDERRLTFIAHVVHLGVRTAIARHNQFPRANQIAFGGLTLCPLIKSFASTLFNDISRFVDLSHSPINSNYSLKVVLQLILLRRKIT
jgi:hypothetical protein